MQIETILLDDYIDSPSNPRIMFKEGDFPFDSLNKSIEEFNYLQPMIVNKRTHHIISGHLRKRVLMAKGITKAEAVIVDFDETKEKAAVIAFNRISGKWDEEKLAATLSELTQIPEFDVGSIGFQTQDLSQILDRYGEQKDADDYDFNSSLESITEPVTKRGDLIQLGAHRILCGDSADSNDLKILMNGEKADILDCDYPYNVSYMQKNNRPSISTRPKKSRRWDAIYADSMPQDEYEPWMRKIMVNIKSYLKPGGPVYIWQGHRQIPPLYQILLDLGFHVSSIVCWLKESVAISYGDYSFRSEHALYGWLEGAHHYWAGKPGESNVWEVHRDPTKGYFHPTQKPVQLAQRALQNSSKINGIVLDTFLGSGSVLIGAESLGRRCFGLEIDPRYCDVIVRRYIAFVGEDKVSEEIKQKYLKEVRQ